MVSKDISFVIPVFNRPNEIDELLKSFVNLNGEKDFEIVIVEDGSINKCDQVIKNYKDLNVSYYFKKIVQIFNDFIFIKNQIVLIIYTIIK